MKWNIIEAFSAHVMFMLDVHFKVSYKCYHRYIQTYLFSDPSPVPIPTPIPSTVPVPTPTPSPIPVPTQTPSPVPVPAAGLLPQGSQLFCFEILSIF